MTSPAAHLQNDLDLWAPVPWSGLPSPLVEAFERADWATVKSELQAQLDGIVTEGRFGRALLQLVRQVPFGSDPILDRYRATADIDHGDWDDIRRFFSLHEPPPVELIGLTKIVTAPVDCHSLPEAEPHHVEWFRAWEFPLRAAPGAFRHRMRRIYGRYPAALWSYDYISTSRYLRYRSLHDAAFGAVSEAHAGRLPVARALAREAQALGLEQEPLHRLARDVEQLLPLAMGSTAVAPTLEVPALIASPTGLSPYGTVEFLYWLYPLVALTRDFDLLRACAMLAERVCARLTSPRGLLYAQTWRVAAELSRPETRVGAIELLPAILAQAQGAAPGLRALPEFLRGIVTPSEAAFALSERLARRAGSVWLEIAALTWMVALNPTLPTARRLLRLMDVTGWRRPVLVPSDICAEAAIALVALGRRGSAIVELATGTGRPSLILAVSGRHLEDASAPHDSRVVAAEALGRLETTHAREVLSRVARGPDDIAPVARRVLGSPVERARLSEREAEVLDLAGKGLTNKQIARQLFLSPHTVARHLANARAKLGAANRTEAALKASSFPSKP